WGIKGADKYLIDEIRGQFGFTQTLQAFKTFKAKHHEASAILVEDKANGPAIIDTLKREISGIIPVEPNGDKVQRLEAASLLVCPATMTLLPSTMIGTLNPNSSILLATASTAWSLITLGFCPYVFKSSMFL